MKSQQLLLHVPGMHCAGCITKIETRLSAEAAIASIKTNLADKIVEVAFDAQALSDNSILQLLKECGFSAHVVNADKYYTDVRGLHKREMRSLLMALAVSGFAMGGMMLLSVSVWGSADGATERLFHLLSALIATPAVFYCGRIFFVQAIRSIVARHWSMDVPISIAVLLAYGKSMYELWLGGGETWFDASVMLLFFLLIGRVLDFGLRAKSQNIANLLLSYLESPVEIVGVDAVITHKNATEVAIGDCVRVAAGARLAVDGLLLDRRAHLDSSALSGESLPRIYHQGEQVHAGFVNMGSEIHVSVNRTAEDSLPARLSAMTRSAEMGRGRYKQIADKVVGWYVPIVHAGALGTFGLWALLTYDFGLAINRAIAVLIITCPCALGLAQPLVQACAAARFLQLGLVAKSGSVFERLATIKHIVFDKTGTLTQIMPQPQSLAALSPEQRLYAFILARHSHHPLSAALYVALADECAELAETCEISDISEIPAYGTRATINGKACFLGKDDSPPNKARRSSSGTSQCLKSEGKVLTRIDYNESIKPHADSVIQFFKQRNIAVSLLSGDKTTAVQKIAKILNIKEAIAKADPQTKINFLKKLKAKSPAMVGDGINDAPALAEAQISLSPASASDIAQSAADVVWLGDDCTAIIKAYTVARQAHKLLKSNFWLAAIYNAIAMPIAVMGYVTPVVAAIAMSTSSIIVTANALRLFWHKTENPSASP